ncbi:MAG: ABC-2 transporter permease [Sphaerochaetaceae bacterium]|jgi:hypothetical protein|nr:ABC-2 transporter permease [Sphaerochaetaceae bacterium]MDD2405757.1 ABC-2 transporter permease [Sphaerochaetaceae bacterium]MDD3670923.1 ABC-2 transporter permease [Sphaerochaetaceae bacterium]MDD4259218.1 ABC-2 transporter permease [Sphaerochaetaceae bacterium]MDD4763182.1 ABC-2 transporter permease [Sphaerochaetaceae bacterium]
MIGLMYKDMMLATLNGKSLLIILLIMLIPFITSGSTTMITTIPMIMTLLLTMTMFAYDNLNKWDRYAMVLPLTDGQVVASRYAVAYGLWLATTILGIVVSVISQSVSKTMETTIGNTIWGVVTSGLAIAVMLAIIIPLIYKFGAEKGRIIIMVIILLPTVIIQIIKPDVASLLEHRMDMDSISSILAPVALVAIALSFFVSVRIYEKKDYFS